ncbi:MAG: hypothetical protein OHK0048_12670 [Rhodoferax sp.]
MLPSYVLLDLETTGSHPVKDRITEVALLRFDQGVLTTRWSSLINPGVPISPFIAQLTGIDNALVGDAPRFADIAPTLLTYLEGATLVAHNVRFDHSFLRAEFERTGVTLRLPTLCTVRLSRLLFPQYKNHGLDAIMQRHGITSAARHRAMGDVCVMQQWLAQVQQELGLEALRAAVRRLQTGSALLPPELQTAIQDIPNTPGVYFFYGASALPLYIGKSVTLRSRVMAHFQAARHDARALRMLQELRRIEWTCTAGELGALLLEAREVKARQPIYNRQLRRERGLCAWLLSPDAHRIPLLTLVRGDDVAKPREGTLYGPYRSKHQALAELRTLAERHQLCLRALGLESGRGRCFAYQLGRCKGVCCGQEPPEQHGQRVRQALSAQQLLAWPYSGVVALREYDPATERSALHVFDQWCHLGSAQTPEELADILAHRQQPLAFDLDNYRLALKYLRPGARPLLPVLEGAQLKNEVFLGHPVGDE